MKTYLILTILLGFNSICIGDNNNIPKGLLELTNKLTTDKETPWGFNIIKSHRLFDKTIQFEDLRVGTPIPVYYIDNDKLEVSSDLPIKSYIYETTEWMVPVFGKEKCVRILYARLKDGEWGYSKSSCCAEANAWQKFRSNWTEEDYPNPILINWGDIKLIHFPDKNEDNLIYLMGSDSLANDLSDEIKIITRMQNILKENKKNYLTNPHMNNNFK